MNFTAQATSLTAGELHCGLAGRKVRPSRVVEVGRYALRTVYDFSLRAVRHRPHLLRKIGKDRRPLQERRREQGLACGLGFRRDQGPALRGSESPPGFHSRPRSRFATPPYGGGLPRFLCRGGVSPPAPNICLFSRSRKARTFHICKANISLVLRTNFTHRR